MIKPVITLNKLLRQEKDVLWLLAASLILWLLFLGNSPLRDWDEGTYALVAREIYRTGNWLYPTIQGEPFLLKPPLMQWLIAISYHIGGVQEFATRLPGAFLTALGVPLLYLVGREVFSQRLPAMFAALVYLTLLPVVRHGRLAMLDGMSISFFLLLLLCLLKARQNRRWALGIGVCLGLISLTKGLLVIVLGAIAFVFLLGNKQAALLKSPYLWIGMIFGNTPAIAWYAAQWHHYGNTFLQVHFQSQAFERLSQAVEGNSGPPWYYLLELLKYAFPWLLLFPQGLYLAWQKRHTSWGSLVLIGTISYLGIISLMRTKLPWYIMPLYPFLALAVAAQLTQIWQNQKRYPRLWVGILVFFAIGGLGGCVYFLLADPQPPLILMSLVLVLTMGLAAWRVKHHNRQFIPIIFSGMYLVLTLLISSHSWIWELNEAFPVTPVAALIRENVSPGTIIYTSFGYNRPSLDFYCDCKVVPATADKWQELLLNKNYLLLEDSALSKIKLTNSPTLPMVENFTLIKPEN